MFKQAVRLFFLKKHDASNVSQLPCFGWIKFLNRGDYVTHTHTHARTRTHSLAVCRCHLKHSGNPAAHPTWNTHIAVTRLHTSDRRRVATPNTGRQFILSIYTCFADCKLHLSCAYFSCFGSTSHIHSSEDWTVSSAQTCRQPRG